MKSGFSIIEMIVVVSIMLISVGGGVVAYSTFSSSQKLRSAKNELVTLLEETRQYAKNNQLPPTVVVGDSLKCVILSVDIPNKKAEIKANGGSLYKTEGITMDKELTIGGTFPCFSYFETKLLDQMTTAVVAPSYTASLILTSLSTGETVTVTVNSLGVIGE